MQVLLPKYVRFPSQTCLKDVVDGFQHDTAVIWPYVTPNLVAPEARGNYW